MSVHRALIMTLLLISCFGLWAQETEDQWQLVSTQSLESLGIEGNFGNSAVLSPDGTMVAYDAKDFICVIGIDEGSENCIPYPEDPPISVSYLSWSPDSRYIAISEDSLRNMVDGDIWLVDIAAQTLVNHTDDGTSASLMRAEPGPEPLIDIAPIWDANTGDLYFVRLQFQDERVSSIYRIAAGDLADAETEPELIADISDPAEAIAVFQISVFSLDGALSVSPDSSQLAMVVRPPSLDSPKSGIWLLDLESGEASQLVTNADLQGIGLPEFEPEMIIYGVDWKSDGSELLVSLSNTARFGPVGIGWNTLRVNTTTGEITPLLDYSEHKSAETLFASTDVELGGLVGTFGAIMIPATDTLLYTANNPSLAASNVWAISMSDGAKPQLVASLGRNILNNVQPGHSSISHTGSQVRVLIGDQLVTMEAEAGS